MPPRRVGDRPALTAPGPTSKIITTSRPVVLCCYCVVADATGPAGSCPVPGSNSRMPIYEYHCAPCRHTFETLIRGQGDPAHCPKCGGIDLTKQFSVPAAAQTGTRQ